MTAPVPTDTLRDILRDARSRTLALVVDLDAEQLIGPRLDIVNPLLWEIGHLAWFHEHFALCPLERRNSLLPNADAFYNSSLVPHDERWTLPLPSLNGTIDYMRGVQDAMLARLEGEIASEEESFLYQLVALHEDMHSEAFIYARQTLGYPAPKFAQSEAVQETETGALAGDVDIPGGEFLLGASPGSAFAFDNEKWAHRVAVAPFRMARAPVTNTEFAAFVEDGGYARREFWDEEGWRWRRTAAAEHPVYWRREEKDWSVRQFDQWKKLPPYQPVMHVNWHEANAWCRWAGRRLPSEAEWEYAAAAEPADGGNDRKRIYPWSDTLGGAREANLDAAVLGCVDVAAHGAGDTIWGCRQMIGNVWEWTASAFQPYPGFSPDVYAEYSQPWFGSRKVLRGGAWATRNRLIKNTYRNFFPPDRRDIFAGFRTVAP
jgi:iron(II)-dependent oxidoreductase